MVAMSQGRDRMFSTGKLPLGVARRVGSVRSGYARNGTWGGRFWPVGTRVVGRSSGVDQSDPGGFTATGSVIPRRRIFDAGGGSRSDPPPGYEAGRMLALRWKMLSES
jgi:hypothetical protein